ncbi:hypothetical protein PAHAL_3G276800 [Panicum hallii]|uniref:Uncharacterized protein n=1 Tax=Panicum hallii TaxID=206008 RepID=A0A2T8KJN2_9POAL|nr:hypothetical protein PAHAL_3G276800 [Panicum hallii]
MGPCASLSLVRSVSRSPRTPRRRRRRRSPSPLPPSTLPAPPPQLEGVPERDGQDRAPEVALARAHGRGSVAPPQEEVEGKVATAAKTATKAPRRLQHYLGAHGHEGAEEAPAGGEQKAPEVVLESSDEVPVRGRGRVGAADGVGVEQQGGRQRLHGEGRRGERGREGEKRHEERYPAASLARLSSLSPPRALLLTPPISQGRPPPWPPELSAAVGFRPLKSPSPLPACRGHDSRELRDAIR